MEYLTEKRGGWDEWSDEYSQIQGLRLDTGELIETRFIDNVFTDKDGHLVQVELPPKIEISYDIKLERYEPEYEYLSVTLSDLGGFIDQGEHIILFDELRQLK